MATAVFARPAVDKAGSRIGQPTKILPKPMICAAKRGSELLTTAHAAFLIN